LSIALPLPIARTIELIDVINAVTAPPFRASAEFLPACASGGAGDDLIPGLPACPSFSCPRLGVS
jgi:hypothetical protein